MLWEMSTSFCRVSIQRGVEERNKDLKAFIVGNARQDRRAQNLGMWLRKLP